MKTLRFVLCGTLLISIASGARRAAASAAPYLESSETAEANKQCWLFMHLQKTGGSTLKGIISKGFTPRFVASYDSKHWKLGGQVLQSYSQKLANESQWRVLVGAYTEAFHRSGVVDGKCKFFTVFRHPVSRLVSAYYYCKHPRHLSDPVCASMVVNANDVDLVEFAEHWGNFAMRQFAVHFVSADDVMAYSRTDSARQKLPQQLKNVSEVPGWYWLKIYLDHQVSSSKLGNTNVPDAALYEMLQPVQDLLRDKYAAVGILEEFNTTLSLFDASLVMPGVDWHGLFDTLGKKVVDRRYKEQEARSSFDAWTDSDIKKHLYLDIVLYEHAVSVFRQQVQAHGIE
eukprot:jgi/Undpi1/5277/HiC_scaffold_2.g00558.m1